MLRKRAQKRASPPQGREWVHEIKYDGYRVQLWIDGDDVRARTRRGYDWSKRFPTLIAAANTLKINRAILDGEVIVQNARSDYPLLQNDLGADRSDRFIYYAFDLLYLDGYDLRDASLIDRKAGLNRLVGAFAHPIRCSKHLESDGETTRQLACDLGLEGLVSKRVNAPYRSARQRDLDQGQVSCG